MGDAHHYAHFYPLAYINASLLVNHLRADGVSMNNLTFTHERFVLFWYTDRRVNKYELWCTVSSRNICIILECDGERHRYAELRLDYAAAVTLVREIKCIDKGFNIL